MVLPGWNENKILHLIIDSSKVDTDLTNFPVNITLSSGTGITGFDATAVFDELTTSGTDSYTKLLLHMDDIALSDDSGSAHTITLNGDATRSSTQSKFGGYSAYFDGSGDKITIPDSEDWDVGSGEFTVDFWLKRVGNATRQFVFGQSDLSANEVSIGVMVEIDTSNQVKGGITVGSTIYYVMSSAIDTDWHHIAIVRYSDTLYLFIDGVSEDTLDATGLTVNNSANLLGIGGLGGFGSLLFNGYIDEFRVSKGIARWTSNFTPPGGPYGSSWGNRKKIAITDSYDNQLYTEIERWDYDNEEANLWAKVPTVSSGTDTDLYLYYDATVSGNTTYVGDTGDELVQDIWDNNFKAVYHMAQDPSIGGACILDSTFNSYNGTPAGSMTADDLVDGKVGKAISFDGNNDYIYIPGSIIAGMSTYTIELLVKWSGIQDAGSYYINGSITAKQYNGSYSNAQIGLSTTDPVGAKIRWAPFDVSNYYTSITSVGDNTWRYVVVQNTPSGQKIFIDGQFDYSNAVTGTFNSDTSKSFTIGAAIDDLSSYSTSEICEVRMSNFERSMAWIKATYYSNWNDLITYSDYIPPSIYYYSGHVTEQSSPVVRTVRLYYRDTGELVSSTTSSGIAGYYYLTTTVSGEHFIVAFDDNVGVDYNALILDKLLPVGVVE